MAYEPELESGERLLHRAVIHLSKKTQPFHFAVSDRALYWPAIKLVALKDPYYFLRFPSTSVQEVSVRRLRPYVLWVLAAAMIISGLLSSYWMMEPILKKTPGKHDVSGAPFAVFVGGLILPFAAKGRVCLRVTTSQKTYKWKPPMVVDKASKETVRNALDEILAACRTAGLRVTDQRTGA